MVLLLLNNKMETLEKITKETCIEQVKALRLTYPTESQEHCRNCIEPCEHYKPISKTQISIKKGVYAMYNFWYKNISIRGLPHDEI